LTDLLACLLAFFLSWLLACLAYPVIAIRLGPRIDTPFLLHAYAVRLRF